MKRFYCTVCKKVKRVRKLPANVTNNGTTNPVNRFGSCHKHGNYGEPINHLLKRFGV